MATSIERKQQLADIEQFFHGIAIIDLWDRANWLNEK